MELLKRHILQIENDLLKPEVRQSVEKINELLADEFIEFCSSGNIYRHNKEKAIAESTNLESLNWEIEDFAITQLAEGILLATYKLIKHNELNENKKYSLRSSLWKCFDGKWKMIFHQGTLISKQ